MVEVGIYNAVSLYFVWLQVSPQIYATFVCHQKIVERG